jgi:hypothetical protein
MWKVLLFFSLLSGTAYADKTAVTNEMGGDESQDSEEYAVAHGNPKAGDAVTNDECLSEETIKHFEKASAKAMEHYDQFGKQKAAGGIAPINVRESLITGKLVPKDFRVGTAEESMASLKKQGFVNLMNCPGWRAKLGDGFTKEVPLGTVLIYDGATYGALRLKTPSGCISSAREKCNNSRKLIGAFVKNVN